MTMEPMPEGALTDGITQSSEFDMDGGLKP
jgi:hypothetical protein